jgi:hypothetical protein
MKMFTFEPLYLEMYNFLFDFLGFTIKSLVWVSEETLDFWAPLGH